MWPPGSRCDLTLREGEENLQPKTLQVSEKGFKLKLLKDGILSPTHHYHLEVSASNRCLKDCRQAGENLKCSTKESQPVKSASTEAQLKHLYANVGSTGRKQVELEMCAGCKASMLLASLRHGGLAPMTGMLGCRVIISLGRAGRRNEEGVSPSTITDQLESMELHLGMDEMMESLWVRIEGRPGTDGRSATGYLTRWTAKTRPYRQRSDLLFTCLHPLWTRF